MIGRERGDYGSFPAFSIAFRAELQASSNVACMNLRGELSQHSKTPSRLRQMIRLSVSSGDLAAAQSTANPLKVAATCHGLLLPQPTSATAIKPATVK
jgi:hypothetical protein